MPMLFTVSEAAAILRAVQGDEALTPGMIRYWDQPHGVRPSERIEHARLYTLEDVALLRLGGHVSNLRGVDPFDPDRRVVSRAGLRAALAYCGPRIRSALRTRAAERTSGKVIKFDGGFVTLCSAPEPAPPAGVGVLLVPVDDLWRGLEPAARQYRRSHPRVWAGLSPDAAKQWQEASA